MKFSIKSVLLAMSAVLFLQSPVRAAEPAYARTCRIHGGVYWSVSMNSRFDTPLCVFGEAAIGAPEFAEYKWGRGAGMSLRSFLKQQTPLPLQGVCDRVGAAYRTAQDSEGSTWELCRFVDGSVIETRTLARGLSAQSNRDFVNALK